MGDSNTITVSTEFGDVTVRKMALNDYAELLRALDKLPKQLGQLINKDVDFKSMETSEILTMLPGIIAESWSDIVALIAVPTDKDSAFLGQLDGPDAVDVVVAIVELNDFKRIIDSVKKLWALRAKVAPANPTSSAQK